MTKNIIRGLLTAGLLLAPVVATAQGRPAPVAEFAAGWVGFADDGIVSEAMAGGAFRWYPLRRVAIGPEIIYISGDNHSHLMLTGNLTFDVLADRAVTPFIVVGGGLFQTHESFPGGGFTSNEGAFTLGGGVRVAAGDRVTIGLDTRIGWETHVRVNATVGIRLGH
jgi:hypothetical protein